MILQYLIPGVFSAVLTFILILIALKFFPKWGLMDRPKKYGLKRKPIPYYGGLILIIVFVISVLIFVKIDTRVIGVVTGGLMIGAVSFLDDLKGLSPWVRLAVQLLAALTIVLSGIGIESISNPFGDPIVLNQYSVKFSLADTLFTITLLADLFTIVWIILIVNTMNFLDGLNGLVSGVTFIAALTLFILAMGEHNVIDQTTVATLIIIAVSMTLVFWFFDFHPAKILLGDTGSMFLGFLIAVFAIFAGGKIATAFLVLGFPILDAFWVITRRIVRGRSPMQGDLKHLHHRLLEVGLTERKALFLIYLLCLFFGGSAVFLGTTQKLYLILVMGLLMVVMASIIVTYGFKRLKKSR